MGGTRRAARTETVKVLIVDDNASIRSVMSIALSTEEGVGEVREAGSGTEAMAMLESWTPDVVVLDYWMPAMMGDATAAAIRARWPGIRIVSFSGVLDEPPDWSDDHFVKGALPDLRLIIRLDD